MGRLKVLIILLFIHFSTNLYSQELIYDVFVEEKPVGNLLVTQKDLDSGKVYYSALLNLEYKLFTPTKMVQLREAIYQNDTLIQAYFVDKRNDSKIAESKIEKLLSKNYYHTLMDTTKGWHEKPIINSELKLYFKKPNSRDSIFSEATHKYNRIAKLPEESRYMMVNEEGEKTIIKYNNEGECVQHNFFIGAVEYRMKLRNGE